MIRAIFIDPWPFWAAGAAVGLFVTLFAWVLGKALGVSTGFGSICSRCVPGAGFFREKPYTDSWRLWFVLGIPLGGLGGALLDGGPTATWAMGIFDTTISGSLPVKLSVLFVGGAMAGFGARMANGCTSGHSIVGIAQGARSSIVATIGFMLAGMAVVNAMYALAGRIR